MPKWNNAIGLTWSNILDLSSLLYLYRISLEDMYYILLRSKSTFLNHSRGHLSLCCYRCFINVLALNFFLERSNLKKSDPCVFALIIDCFYVRHLVGMEKKLLKSTTLADLCINFHYQNYGCLLIFLLQIGR